MLTAEEQETLSMPEKWQRMLEWLDTDAGEKFMDKFASEIMRKSRKVDQLFLLLESLPTEQVDTIIRRICTKRSKRLLSVLFQMANTYGTDNDAEDANIFVSSSSILYGFTFDRIDGQGSMYTISDSTTTLYSSPL